MNDIVIGSTNVSIKEYKGQRVVTFKDIDTVHGRPDGTARRNFNRNKEHFIEGEDFFVRNSYEAKKEYNATAPNGLVLITESGYLMLAKSFTDSKAWDVQRALVKSYFVKKPVTYPVPNSMAELMRCYDKLPEKQKNAVLVKIKEAEKLSKTNELCVCAAKFYFDGKTDVPCVTIDDIADLTGIPRSTIHHEMHKRCRAEVDYLLLEGEELVEFKKKNPSVNERCHLKLNIIFKSGFDILMKFFNKVLSCEQPKHFKAIEDKAFKVNDMAVTPTIDEYITTLNVLKHVKKCTIQCEITTQEALDTATTFCAVAMGKVAKINYCRN